MSGDAGPVRALNPFAIPLAGPHLVEASAGTGKTYTIGTLVLRLLLEDPPDSEEPPSIDRILVVTFTRAATGELRGRVRERLAAALVQVDGGTRVADEDLAGWLDDLARGDPSRCRERLRSALRDFDDAAIFTIHGFCQRMLQEYAFESGVDFEAELVGDESELRRTAVQDFWARVTYDAPSLAVAWLQGPGKLKLHDLEQLGKDLAATPTVPRVPARDDGPALGPEDLARLEADFRAAWSAAAGAWRQGGTVALGLVAEAAAAGALHGSRYRPGTLLGRWQEQLAAFFASLPPLADDEERKVLGYLAAGRMKVNKNGHEPQHPFFDTCALLVDALEDVESELEPWGLALRHDLDEWLQNELPERKRRARQQSYDDLLHQLHRALNDATPRARRLASRIRGRYRAALIDEFQDTDLVQYQIFRRVFAPEAGSGANGSAVDAPPLLLIGDPKQAIYAFRGADVFAYLEAVTNVGADRRHTLTVNYRADESLVAAVNEIWQLVADRRPFLFDEIPFVPVVAHHSDRLSPPSPPVTLAYVPATVANRDGDGKVVNVGLARRATSRAAATAIGGLLRAAPQLSRADGTVTPVAAGDVAVLVRANHEARRMQRVLRAHRIPSVLSSDASVLDQGEADELRQILGAIVEPANARRVRAALVTTALGQDATDIDHLAQDEREWEEWIERFRSWQDAWRRVGFLPAVRRMLDEQGVPARLLGLMDGERRLTNLLHLAELLHAVAFQMDLGPEGLLAWFDRVREDSDLRQSVLGDTAQLRLESDAAAVRIATVHKAKGLEYPFVFCPFLWQGARGRLSSPLRYHDLDGDRHPRLDIGAVVDETGKQAAALEELAEELRLLYVAMTRARHGLWLAWGPFNKLEKSALAYLLLAGDVEGPVTEGNSSAVLAAWCDVVSGAAKADLNAAARAEAPDEDPLWQRTQALAAAQPQLIAAVRLTPAGVQARFQVPPPTEPTPTVLAARQAGRKPRRTLFRSSFTGLTRGEAESALADVADGVDHDALATTADGLGDESGVDGVGVVGPPFAGKGRAAGPAPGLAATAGRAVDSDTNAADAASAAVERVPLADLVAGTRLGTGLHTLLERIDFKGEPEKWQAEANRLASRRALPQEAVQPLVEALNAVLKTPLGAGELEFSFADVGRRDRLNEMRYALPVAVEARQGRFAARAEEPWGAADAGGPKTVGPADLARVLAAHPGGALPPDYPRRLGALPAQPFAGWLSGSLDLVFRRPTADGADRWYVADWKSNRLGTTWDDYAPERLVEAMAHHHYFLQAHLYAVALHRHLKRCQVDYDYEQHFGGSLYVFVRGMRQDRPGSGVVFDRPPLARIQALDELLRAGQV